jgi:hypothetical protein
MNLSTHLWPHDRRSTDWLQITIKFRGKCCECGKEITSGRALSKSIKAVKRIELLLIR